MPKKLFNEVLHRDPIAHTGKFEAGDGDLMMKRTRRNFGPEDIDAPEKKVQHDNTDLLKQIFDQEIKNTYGKKYPERNAEASMYELLSGGFEAPLENDYTKGFFQRGDKPLAKKKLIQEDIDEKTKKPKKPISLQDLVKKDLIHRINKSDSQYVSETHDNYRKYQFDNMMKSFLYDHLQNPERANGKPPVEIEDWMLTVYQRDYINRMKKLARENAQKMGQEAEFDRALAEDEEQDKENNRTKQKSNLKKTNGKKAKDDEERSRRMSVDSPNKQGQIQSSRNNQQLRGKSTTGGKSWKEKTLQKSSDMHRMERIKELHKWARWLPDSAYQSYFGKPAFHCYGRKNTKPTAGGHVYGQYMLTHNVNPEHGQNEPKYQQVYRSAMNFGFRNGDRVPVLSRKGHDNLDITPSELEKMKKRNPIMPKKFVNPDPADEYTEVSEGEYDFSHYQKKRDKLNFHPKNNANANRDVQHEDQDNNEDNEGEGNDEEAHEIDAENEAVSGAPDFDPRNTPTPAPGTLEYKRMLEQFVNNPEYVRLLTQSGKDLQNMFPFCSVHNSYGQQLPIHELDPRNYKFLPAKYTQRIAPAGKQTQKSHQLYGVILPDN